MVLIWKQVYLETASVLTWPKVILTPPAVFLIPNKKLHSCEFLQMLLLWRTIWRPDTFKATLKAKTRQFCVIAALAKWRKQLIIFQQRAASASHHTSTNTPHSSCPTLQQPNLSCWWLLIVWLNLISMKNTCKLQADQGTLPLLSAGGGQVR